MIVYGNNFQDCVTHFRDGMKFPVVIGIFASWNAAREFAAFCEENANSRDRFTAMRLDDYELRYCHPIAGKNMQQARA